MIRNYRKCLRTTSQKRKESKEIIRVRFTDTKEYNNIKIAASKFNNHFISNIQEIIDSIKQEYKRRKN